MQLKKGLIKIRYFSKPKKKRGVCPGFMPVQKAQEKLALLKWEGVQNYPNS